ncbi:MAG: hypothetical protein DWQ44_10080 [Bacteroidetes bacterium]|nr:MAG: hypothetical protein DWQ39_03870 [Bacteroidota bacterium]REK33392.1 MAG: hypothetical protein DWQ44_10080 [Bacteroidota bacterium]REK49791.1 MAG: hypothetical protein DWQ48_06635 [Bacteroidota bacterium]
MIKLYFLVAAIVLTSLGLQAQTHENSWINYNQQYFKVKVWQDGIYRIRYSALQFGGFPISTVDPRKIQIIRDGVEQHIYIQGESDGVFDSSDYIEFYGRKNDGKLDTRMYADSMWQANKNFSLFNDTATYFITWDNNVNGKRLSIQNNTNYASYTPSPYFIKNSYQEFSSVYNRGMNDKLSDYVESEGWGAIFGNYSGGQYPLSVTVNTSNMAATGPNVEIKTAVAGVNNIPHKIRIAFPGTTFTDYYLSQSLRRYTFTAPLSQFTGSNTLFTFDVTTPIDTPEYNSLFWLSVKYPHTFNMEGASTFRMYVPDEAGGKAYLDMSNFAGGSQAPILYDLTNNAKITVSLSGSNYRALVDNDAGIEPKECFIAAESQVKDITEVSGISYAGSSFGYFNDFLGSSYIRDSAYIIVTHRNLWNEAMLYKNYRDITTGNKVIIVDVEELYDQFAYGIRKHPMSIKNFSRFLLDRWITVAPPQHMFLIGKSISPADSRNNTALYAANLVPSYGVPTSDLLLTSGINGSLYEPTIPIGRLSAQNLSDVSNYRHKVEEYEAAQSGPPQPWMKEILHFGGGDSPAQQYQLSNYLRIYENVLEGSYFGGNVTTYLKTSTNPIVINQSDSLQAKIDEGVALMTFFGHASGSGFDQSTDEPHEYGNHGRYPLIVANSCFAGDIHTSQRSISEKFVMEPEKAAIGFIASVGLGIPNDLFSYTNALFEHASQYNYGATVGFLMKKAIETIQIPGIQNIQVVCNEMSLHGDPALRLNYFSKPDYVISESQIYFDPPSVSTDLDSFSVSIITRNIGKAVTDSFDVRITRTFPDGTDSVYVVKRGNCFYQDELTLNLETGNFKAAGINRFKVEVDFPDSVDEFDNISNNLANTTLFITSNDIVPVYPYRFAIHPFNTVSMKASTSNPLATQGTYRFELDTVDLMVADTTPGMQRSPLYRSTTITGSGGLIEWTPPAYTLLDSAVYFWRVANDSIQFDPQRFKWQESSFMYIPGKTGWAQSHFFQFRNDEYENVKYSQDERKFNFVENNKSLRVLTYGNPASIAAQNEMGYYLNNAVVEYNGCQASPAVFIAVLDSVSLNPWTTCNYNVGQANQFILTSGTCNQNPIGVIPGCNRTRPENYFMFRFGTPAQIQSIPAFINSVPNGNYIIAYNWFTDYYSAADPSFVNTFNSLGFNMAALQDTAPFALFIQKGNPSSKIEMFGSGTSDTLNIQSLLTSIWNRGTVNSDIIGPARSWESLHWNQIASENPTTDIIYLNLLGLNRITKNWDTLYKKLQFTPSGIDTSLSWISASQYAYIRLQAFTQDDDARTPAQMQYWRIYFDEVPECALNPSRTFVFHSDPLDEGDTLRLSVAIDNVGILPMDSLAVKFYLYDNNRNRRDLKLLKLDSLRVGQSLTASLLVDSTFGLAGSNSLWVEANPLDTLHQTEKYHFNNLAEIRFKMNRDQINPVLDVTFDGIHILDKDIVSGRPNITIQLHDENKFLALNDTSNFKVYIRPPGSNSMQRVYFTAVQYPAMNFTPAILPKNSCRIEWNPEFTQDGIYMLEVEATDASKNESGKYNYKISFEVINRSTITEVLNYPNPFSTSTRFVFTLTGNEIPSYMKIQIMTVSGKIVREITTEELGNIHIGRNITEYAWDGRDEYGDKLANGLYLYRVITDIHGEKIEKRETDADKYFRKGWGKMYLMR